MSKAVISFKLIENDKEIAKKIYLTLLPQIEKYFNNIYKKLQNTIPTIIIENIKFQPEYSSLLSGSLNYEFGLVEPEQKLSEILNAIQTNTKIQIQKPVISNGGIQASLKIKMIQSDFNDLLSLGAASFTTEKGVQLDWLKWLLIEGDSVIISDYFFVLGSSPYSRTGMGIMRQSGGSFWRVPPEFSGTIRNNWITRAIGQASDKIKNELEKAVKG